MVSKENTLASDLLKIVERTSITAVAKASVAAKFKMWVAVKYHT